MNFSNEPKLPAPVPEIPEPEGNNQPDPQESNKQKQQQKKQPKEKVEFQKPPQTLANRIKKLPDRLNKISAAISRDPRIRQINGVIREAINSKVGRILTRNAQYLLSAPNHNNDASRKIMGKKPNPTEDLANLSAENAAIYIGAMYHQDFLKNLILNGLFAMEPEDRIYNERMVKASLHYAFKNSTPGEKVQVVVTNHQSELLNGTIDRAMTTKQEIGAIKTLARKFFPERVNDLELIPIEEIPENKSLYDRLESAKNPETKHVDIAKAYKVENEPKLSKNPSALEIAQFLYFVAEKNPEIKEAFANMRPNKIKETSNTDASIYYGLTEIAVRLRAIMSGQHIHIGADRQAIYDQFILSILKLAEQENKPTKPSKKKKTNQPIQEETGTGAYRQPAPNPAGGMQDLLPLSQLFAQTKLFETAHIDTRNNFYEHQMQRKQLIIRLMIFFSIGGQTAVGAKYLYEKHKFNQRQREHIQLIAPPQLPPAHSAPEQK